MRTGSAARIGNDTERRESTNSTAESRGGCAGRKTARPVTGTKDMDTTVAVTTDSLGDRARQIPARARRDAVIRFTE
ncbi:hypothetical protein GCM10017579_02330 [Nocardioides luteus]|uniref:Uncharacterized protein n=1 Tax=Nocardioides luteus TaxID=1844 RepID=A0ABQ5SRW3_9ACTN|nr:hypothetical protein GCM10017579_02330 [Nocardioides luteus]